MLVNGGCFKEITNVGNYDRLGFIFHPVGSHRGDGLGAARIRRHGGFVAGGVQGNQPGDGRTGWMCDSLRRSR